jgi:hypothetical protein
MISSLSIRKNIFEILLTEYLGETYNLNELKKFIHYLALNRAGKTGVRADTEEKRTALYQAARELFRRRALGIQRTDITERPLQRRHVHKYYASMDKLFTGIRERETGK